MKNTLNVVMVGGRRCGKTSVIASMAQCYKQVVKESKLTIEPTLGTDKVLDDKLKHLSEDLFSHGAKSFTIDEDASSDVRTFAFKVKSKSEVINLSFTDIPGEYFVDGINDDVVEKTLDECSIVIIAVDTVQMMEEGGVYSESYNRTGIITEWMQKSDFTATDGPKLVLFVPLKCEKYYLEKRMSAVNERIQQEYDNLISFLTCSELKDKITIAITPILTLGNVIFDKYGRDANNQVIVHKNSADGVNYRPVYTYYKCIGDKFSPFYCEQPFLYILQFVVKLKELDERVNKHSNFQEVVRAMKMLARVIVLGPIAFSLTRYMYREIARTTLSLKRKGDGYQIIQNPINL